MLFSEEWLRSVVNPDLTSDELAEAMTMAGLEVEDCSTIAPAFEGVVVAEVVDCVDHENSDHLHVCKVNVGAPELLQIVCGAPNVKTGVKVPCATIGAVLPGNFKIKKAKKIYREGNFPEKDSFWLQERLKPSKRKNHDLVFLFQGEWHHILVYSQTDQKNPYLPLPSYLLDGKKEYADVIGILTDSDLFDGKRIANVGKIIPVTYDGRESTDKARQGRAFLDDGFSSGDHP